MNQYELVRTAHRVYGQNISELARTTGTDLVPLKNIFPAKRALALFECSGADFLSIPNPTFYDAIKIWGRN